jgi:hypothetical protein
MASYDQARRLNTDTSSARFLIHAQATTSSTAPEAAIRGRLALLLARACQHSRCDNTRRSGNGGSRTVATITGTPSVLALLEARCRSVMNRAHACARTVVMAFAPAVVGWVDIACTHGRSRPRSSCWRTFVCATEYVHPPLPARTLWVRRGGWENRQRLPPGAQRSPAQKCC